MIPTREDAWKLLTEYTASEALRIHAMAVEGVMRHFAAFYGEDVELWGVCGLLHDVDYDRYPDEHCTKCREIMKNAGCDDLLIRAVASHGWGICSELEPQSTMEKTLYTIDELTGLINACAILRPSKSVIDLELKSVKKKFKTKGFAAGCDRSLIEKGSEMMGMPLDDVITHTIEGMREVAGSIGLAGSAD